MRPHIALLFIFAFSTATAATLKESYDHFVSLDEEQKYMMYWTMNDTTKTINIAVEVKTTGWIGFGISPYTGRMPGSDTVIGWVDSQGRSYLQDRFAPSHAVPDMDAQQDYNLISGEEKNGMTIMKFSRKYNTSDSKDLVIEGGTTRLIWSYNDVDPVSPSTFTKHKKQGTRSVNLFTSLPEAAKPPLPSDAQYFDLHNPNVTIPTRDTIYWCTAFKLPEVNGTAHMIRIDPLIEEKHEGLVHHILVYDCVFEESLIGSSHNCDSQNMPQGLRGCRGATVIGAWAVGGGPLYYPAHVGLPLGQRGARYVVMETHYDNPLLKSGLTDSSGMRFYYTHQLRKYDAGVLEIGQSTTPFMVIPEGQSKWQVAGYCSENCTRPNLPPSGIKFFGGLLHTHLTGFSVVTKHYRGNKELPELISNRHYDFNFQETEFLRKEVTFLPGDQLTVICTYNTKSRRTVTVGGIATRDEMCLAYMLYYPRTELAVCFSRSNYYTYLDYYRTLRDAGRTPPYNNYGEQKPPPYAWHVIRNGTIGNGKYLKKLYELDNHSPPRQYCAARNHVSLQPTNPMDIPKFVRYHTNAYLKNTFETPAPTNPATATKRTVSGASKAHFSSLIIYLLPFLAFLLRA